MQRKFPPHPSGRPRPARSYRHLPITREPPDRPLTPGLRREQGATAIGFHTGHIGRDTDEDHDA